MFCCRPPRKAERQQAFPCRRRSARGFGCVGCDKGAIAMSTFDDPFDVKGEFGAGCICGRHRSAAQHDRAERALRCEPGTTGVQGDEKRYESVVASALMRAVFPKDVARRALLRSVGAATALA